MTALCTPRYNLVRINSAMRMQPADGDTFHDGNTIYGAPLERRRHRKSKRGLGKAGLPGLLFGLLVLATTLIAGGVIIYAESISSAPEQP